jgi:hypothetical protein
LHLPAVSKVWHRLIAGASSIRTAPMRKRPITIRAPSASEQVPPVTKRLVESMVVQRLGRIVHPGMDALFKNSPAAVAMRR